MRETKLWLSESGVHTQVLNEDILRCARSARKSTRGGLQQISPWVLRQAIESSPSGSCAWAIADLSNRISRGAFDTTIGRLECTAWTVALWKDASHTKIRPISGGGALRKIMVKAHCEQVKDQLYELVGRR